jgi:hypothetical protein
VLDCHAHVVATSSVCLALEPIDWQQRFSLVHPRAIAQGRKDKKGGKKKKKDPTADRSIESLFAELVSNGILQPCPHVHVRDYIGCSSYMQATLEKVRTFTAAVMHTLA